MKAPSGFNARNRSVKTPVSSAGFNWELAPLRLGRRDLESWVLQQGVTGRGTHDSLVVRIPLLVLEVGVAVCAVCCIKFLFPPSDTHTHTHTEHSMRVTGCGVVPRGHAVSVSVSVSAWVTQCDACCHRAWCCSPGTRCRCASTAGTATYSAVRQRRCRLTLFVYSVPVCV